MLISTITSNIPFIQLSLMHRITEKICKERWQHWCTKISGVKVLPTLLISTITSNMSFIQLSLMLSGYPASSSSWNCCKYGASSGKDWLGSVEYWIGCVAQGTGQSWMSACIAEPGFDPRTFGFWPQHASNCATPLSEKNLRSLFQMFALVWCGSEKHLRSAVPAFFSGCMVCKFTDTVGLEPTTTRLRALRSTDWARRAPTKAWKFKHLALN